MNDTLKLKKIIGILIVCSSFAVKAEPTFEPPLALSGVSGPVETWGVSSADVNNDYCPDLFFGNHRGQPSLYIGHCDGTFTSEPDFIQGDNIHADDHTTVFGDFNNDGCPDMHMSVGGTNPSIENDKNQFLLGELDSGNCTGNFIRDVGSSTEYPEQRARSAVPFDANFDGDMDLATTGYDGDSQSTGGDEEVFENLGQGLPGNPWMFEKRAIITSNTNGIYYGFEGHTKTLFNIFANIIGDAELDLICGESTFPREECTFDISASPFLKNFLDLVDPAKSFTVDAFAEDIDNDGDNDLVALRRNNVSGNAKRYNNDTVVEGINTTNTTSGIRCLGIPGAVDINTFTITGDYVDSEDIKFGSSNHTIVQPSTESGSARRYVFSALGHTNSLYTGLSLPDTSDGVEESERGTYVGYLDTEQMWKVCDVSGSKNQDFVPPIVDSANDPRTPKRRFNKYGMRIVFSGSVDPLIHENYDPSSEPITPVVWINNGKNGDQTIFEDNSIAAGLTGPVTAFGLGKGDFDNDGDMDFVASYENHGVRGNNYLYTNDGSGVFTRTRFAPCSNGVAESVAVIDANADGLLDPVMGCAWYGLAHNTSYEHTVWLNDTDNANKAIMFSIVGNGTSVNRDGIGARIKVTDANDRTNVVCSRDVGNTFGRGSQDSEFVHCGVATRETVDVIIDWPGAVGGQDIYDDVTTAAMYELTQGSSVPTLIKTLLNSTVNLPVVEVNYKNLEESEGMATLLIRLDNDGINNTASNILVDYTTKNITAISGTDYTEVSGTAQIEPGKKQVVINIPIIDDNIPEPTETFEVVLSDALGATINPTGGIVTVTDLDEYVVEANYKRLFESEGSATILIRLDNDETNNTDSNITVDYQTEDTTAVAGTDYTSISGTAVIESGKKHDSISIPILNNDGVSELTETFKVTLSNPVGATVNETGGVVTIDDD